MRKVFISFLVVAAVFIGAFTSEAAKKKVAVLDFDYGTIRDRWWPGDWDIGKGISDMMVTQLVKDGTFSVIERKQLEKVLSEQRLGASGLVDASTAAQIGKILGVKYVILGSITQFGIDTKNIDTGGFGRMLGLGADVDVSTAVATVYIDARMIDTTTAEIVAVAEGKASESKSNVKVSASDRYQGYGHVAIGGSGFDETILGQATRNCVGDVVKQLSGKTTGTGGNAGGAIKTKVADTDAGSGTVYIAAGSGEGITVGQTLYVVKIKKEIKDPETGEVIKRVVEAAAELKVTEVDNKSATATIVKGNINNIKIGDNVSSTPSL